MKHSRGRAARGRRRFWALLVGLAMLGMSVQAAPRLLGPGEHAQWQAIGRVNQAGFRSRSLCTGTLIAPDLVLTAAHCFDPDRSDPVVFVAGWYRGSFVAAREVVEVTRGPGFVLGAAPSPQMVARDWALLRLEAEIPEIEPLRVGALEPYAEVDLVAYSVTKPHALTLRSHCATEVATPVQGAGQILPIACPAIPGNSGGPVLARHGAGWRVVGVVSAASRTGRSLAVVPGAAFQALTR